MIFFYEPIPNNAAFTFMEKIPEKNLSCFFQKHFPYLLTDTGMCAHVYISIYIYINIYIFLQEKPKFGHIRIMNLFPSS